MSLVQRLGQLERRTSRPASPYCVVMQPDETEASPLASWCAREGDAIGPREDFLAELRAAIARYSERNGIPESLAATLAAAYCDDRGRALRAGL